MSEIVEQLWELQSVLSNLAEKDKALNEKPASYATAEKELNESEAEIARLGQRAEELSKQRRKIEGELSDAQEGLKKFQGQLMQVKNQTQYAAALQEIDASRRGVKELEDALLALMTQVEEVTSDLATREEAHAGIRERHDREFASWQGSLSHLRTEAAAIKAKAEVIEAALPANLRRHFQQVFKQRNGVAMAKVSGDACGECRTRLRPAVIQQLKRGEVVICDSCRRFYYLEKVAS